MLDSEIEKITKGQLPLVCPDNSQAAGAGSSGQVDGGLIGTVTNHLDGLGGSVLPPLGQLTDPLGTILHPLGPVTDTVGGILDHLDPLASTVGEILSPLGPVTATVGKILDPLGPIVSPLGPVLQSVTGAVGQVLEPLDPVTGAVGQVLEPLGPVTGEVGKVLEPLGPVTEAVGKVVKPLEPVTSTVGQVVKSPKPIVKPASPPSTPVTPRKPTTSTTQSVPPPPAPPAPTATPTTNPGPSAGLPVTVPTKTVCERLSGTGGKITKELGLELIDQAIQQQVLLNEVCKSDQSISTELKSWQDDLFQRLGLLNLFGVLQNQSLDDQLTKLRNQVASEKDGTVVFDSSK